MSKTYWCPHCKTELSARQTENHAKKTLSMYVKFDLTSEALTAFIDLKKISQKEGAIRTSLLSWTSTPWTIPANVGLALHPAADYVAIKAPTLEGTEIWIMAKELQASVEQLAGFGKPSTPLLIFKADQLYRNYAKHPFLAKKAPILLDDEVSQSIGTGVLQLAPGFDGGHYRIASKYGLDIYDPIDSEGKFTSAIPELQGKFVFGAEDLIVQLIQDAEHLLARDEMSKTIHIAVNATNQSSLRTF